MVQIYKLIDMGRINPGNDTLVIYKHNMQKSIGLILKFNSKENQLEHHYLTQTIISLQFLLKVVIGVKGYGIT